MSLWTETGNETSIHNFFHIISTQRESHTIIDIQSVISLHSALTMQTPPYNGHPDNTGSRKIPCKNKLQLFDSEISSCY